MCYILFYLGFLILNHLNSNKKLLICLKDFVAISRMSEIFAILKFVLVHVPKEKHIILYIGNDNYSRISGFFCQNLFKWILSSKVFGINIYKLKLEKKQSLGTLQ